jgi:hypothetical protein
MIKLDYLDHIVVENNKKKTLNELTEKYYEKVISKKFNLFKDDKIRNIWKINGKNIFEKETKKDKKFTQVTIIDLFNKIKKFDSTFSPIELKDLILAKPNEITKYTNTPNTEYKTLIEKTFDYKGKFQTSVITDFFTDNFNFTTCYYCNKDFILNFNKSKKTSTFQLDHFYDKEKYPYLALSFYNLIPSCSTCNSTKVKGSKDCFKYDVNIREEAFENEICKIPNHKDFDFDKKVKFKLFLTDSCKDLNIKEKDNIDIPLKERYSNEYEKYIEVFKLNERYQAHKDIVFKMIKNAELYPESRLKELQDLTGIPFQEIKKDIFKLIDDEVDLSKEPFSKLRRDMAWELGLR